MNYCTKPLLVLLGCSLLQSAPVFAKTSCEAAYQVKEDVAYLEIGKAKPVALPEPGPGQKCEKIWADPHSKYVIAQVETGALGTQVLVQHTYLLVYEVAKGALKELKRIELKSTERSSKGTHTLKDCEAIVPELKSKARFEIQLKCQGSASIEAVQIP
ncbi:MAG: hypothetical protein ACJ763_16575 [Bdellovibrionia bacterium]